MKKYLFALILFNLCNYASTDHPAVGHIIPILDSVEIPTTVVEFEERRKALLGQLRFKAFQSHVQDARFQALLAGHAEEIKAILNTDIESYFGSSLSMFDDIWSGGLFFQPFTDPLPIRELIGHLIHIFEAKSTDVASPLELRTDKVRLDIGSIGQYDHFPYLWIIHQALKDYDDPFDLWMSARKYFSAATGLSCDCGANLYCLLNILFPEG